MDKRTVISFFRDNWRFIAAVLGVVLMTGILLNWRSIYKPSDQPDSCRRAKVCRQITFLMLGIVLLILGLWILVMILK